MEVTKWLKPSVVAGLHIGDGASVRAATRVNAEQNLYMSRQQPSSGHSRFRVISLQRLSGIRGLSPLA